MSTIEEVRVAEKKVQEALNGLKTEAPDNLGTELTKATDEYFRAVRELDWKKRNIFR